MYEKRPKLLEAECIVIGPSLPAPDFKEYPVTKSVSDVMCL